MHLNNFLSTRRVHSLLLSSARTVVKDFINGDAEEIHKNISPFVDNDLFCICTCRLIFHVMPGIQEDVDSLPGSAPCHVHRPGQDALNAVSFLICKLMPDSSRNAVPAGNGIACAQAC